MQNFEVPERKIETPLRAMEQYLDKVKQNIEHKGYHVQMMFGDAKAPILAYTTGLMPTPAKCELIVIGGVAEEITALIENVAVLLHDGLKLQEGSRLEGIIKAPVAVELVDQKEGLRFCAVFRRTYPALIEDVQFYQLHILANDSRSQGTGSNRSSIVEGRKLGSYLKRARTPRAVA